MLVFSSLERRHFLEDPGYEADRVARGPAEAYAEHVRPILVTEERLRTKRAAPERTSGIPDLDEAARKTNKNDLEELEIELWEISNRHTRQMELCAVDWALKTGSHWVVFVPSGPDEPVSFRAALFPRKHGEAFHRAALSAMQKGTVEPVLARMERILEGSLVADEKKAEKGNGKADRPIDMEARFYRTRFDTELAYLRAASQAQFPGIVREIKRRHRQGEREAAKQLASIPGISRASTTEGDAAAEIIRPA